jgi:hypothetical protein
MGKVFASAGAGALQPTMDNATKIVIKAMLQNNNPFLFNGTSF